ncbi:MAG: nucleotidyl transferase AbiEii/AbiGii toxin family protein [Streptosporangiaceae bacterium]
MTRPSRETASGRAYLDLLARARREHRPSGELLTLYVLERFPYRLSVSAHRDRLILKGGMLLSAFGQRRPTRDIDLLAKATSNEPAAVAALVGEIADLQADDGVIYETSQMTTRMIRDQNLYAAVRVAVPARIDRARQPLRLDLNVGDPVTPAPAVVSYPALPGEPFPLLAYPIEVVLAEKLVTMVARGDTSTRDRDFADVLLLAGHHDVDGTSLSEAIAATAGFRKVDLRPISETLVTLGRDRQREWQRLLTRAGLESLLPSDYTEAIRQVTAFGDPVITGSLTSGRWDHRRGQWTA